RRARGRRRGDDAAWGNRAPSGGYRGEHRGCGPPARPDAGGGSMKGGTAFAVLCVLCACEESGARPTATVSAPDSADQVLEGFSHFVTNQGVRRSRVEADTAYFYEATQITQLRKLRVVFYNVKGEEGSTLTAKSGTYRWQDGSMEADSNVVVVSPDGRRLTTERLRYDNASNTISTDRRFSFDRDAEHLEGNSFRSDP